MENELYDYSPVTQRPPAPLPDGKRLAFYVGVNIEHFLFGRPSSSNTPLTAGFVPDPLNHGWRDYGTRVGIWRMMDLFDEVGLRASAITNSQVCERYPQIVKAGVERDWAWVAHGQTNSVLHTGMDEAAETAFLDEMLRHFDAALPSRPRGWLGPALTETAATPRLLRERGFTYLLDWCCDDRPFALREPGLISVPYSLDVNDFGLFIGQATTGSAYEEIVMDQFEVLLAEGGAVMALPVHPFITGQPFRFKYLARVLRAITSTPEVWVTTSTDIADRFQARTALRLKSGTVPESSPAASAATSRAAADRCPGALRLTEAADGFLARIRLPGGLVSAAQLRVLARLAGDLGDGGVELTSRGNVQLRGLAPDAAGPLTEALSAAGLLPSLDHDRVRNILASPLAGLDGGPGLTGIVRALDAELCARPRLASLPGRFLFAIDDGRGDVAGHGADVLAVIRNNGAILNGLAVTPDQVVTAMLACAEAFLDERAAHGDSAVSTRPCLPNQPTPTDPDRPPVWRIADLPHGHDRVRDAVAERLGLAVAPAASVPARPGAVAGARPVGLVRRAETGGAGEEGISVRDDAGAAVVVVAPLGRLAAAQLTWVCGRAGRVRVTPWRSVVLPRVSDPDAVLREAAALGFGVDAASPWLRVTACAGRPGCASALADVRADAATFAERWPGRIVHVSGCARHCGRQAATEIDVTATSEGYQVAGV